MKNTFVFDYDSTLISVESFDEMIFSALEQKEDFEELKQKIEKITHAGMNGEIDLAESLKKRLEIASITQKEIDSFASSCPNLLTPGIKEIVEFLQEKDQKIFILSGGFLETIYPVADFLNIPRAHCFANEFTKDNDGNITGVDFNNPLSSSSGKITVIQNGKKQGSMPGKIFCIGDGMSDAKPFLEEVADNFLGFGQNVVRDAVRKKAPHFFVNTEGLGNFLKDLL